MLTVRDIMTRYGLKDERSARGVIREAGGRKIAGRLRISRELLEAWERNQPEERSTIARMNTTTVSVTSSAPPTPNLDPDWWKHG